MKNDDHKLTLEIFCSREKVFKSISKELSNWWGKQNELIEKKGSIFKVSWGEPWYKFKVIEYKRNLSMIWECIDANQKIEGVKGVEKEWVGTKVHWELEKLDINKTLLHFKHEGLVPEFVCFDFCSRTWDYFLKERLKGYLEET